MKWFRRKPPPAPYAGPWTVVAIKDDHYLTPVFLTSFDDKATAEAVLAVIAESGKYTNWAIFEDTAENYRPPRRGLMPDGGFISDLY